MGEWSHQAEGVPANNDEQEGASRRVAVGCQPVRSSRVTARERMVAVRCKLTERGGGERKDCEQASPSRQTGHSQGFWDDDETE